MGKIWSINPLFVVTQKMIFFSIIYFTAIINHAFSRIDDYVNALIERHIALSGNVIIICKIITDNMTQIFALSSVG